MNVKFITYYSVLFIVFLSCTDEEIGGPEIVGDWLLIEQNIGFITTPGDFQPVQSTKIISINAFGRYTAEGSLCDLDPLSTVEDRGRYSFSNGTITSNFCPDVSITFEFENGDLILDRQCFEGCLERYRRISE
ncbi:MAG: hypothetical protein AAF363_12365 [Bacteroidota bacterium]